MWRGKGCKTILGSSVMSEPRQENGWLTTELGRVVNVNPEALGQSTDPDFGFRYLDIASVTKGLIDWESLTWHTFQASPSRARRVLKDGDVVFGTVRPGLQSHGYVRDSRQGPLVGSTGFGVLRAKPGFTHNRYLYHYVMSAHVAAEARRAEVGSNYPAVNEYDVQRFAIELPPIDEQRRIADILDTLDDTIRKTEEIIAKLQQAKQGLLHDLLTRGIDENGELRDPERHPEQFKETVLGRVPSDWSVKRLTEIAEILDHLRIPINAEERERRTGNVPYYGANGQQGWIDRPLFCEPLVLLAEDGGSFDEYATRPIAYRIDGPSWVNNHAHVLKAQSGVNRSFFFFSLEHRDIRRYISGGTRTKLTQSELRSIEVAVPNLPEQNLLAAIMEEHESVIQHEKRALLTVRLLKQGLMDDLLTGKVRVPEAEEALA